MIEAQIEAESEGEFLNQSPLERHPIQLQKRGAGEVVADGNASLASSLLSSALKLSGPPTGVSPLLHNIMPTLQQDILSIFRGFRNGMVYGVKIRFPHALVMTFLFIDGSLKKKWDVIYSKTSEHAWHLGQYVCLYKLMCAVIRRIFRTPNYWLIHFLSGAVAGGIIWGKKTSVNHQINLYVFSRICYSMALSGIERGYWKNYSSFGYKIFAILIWAIVMYLFEYEEHNVNPSLKESMDYLYHNDKELTDWSIPSLINFVKS